MLTRRRDRFDVLIGAERAHEQADLQQADMWTQKAMGARKQNELIKEKKAATGGVTMQ